MTLYFFVLLTLLKFAVCLPGPNVNVDIDVRVDAKGCVGGGCDKINNDKISEDIKGGCKSGTTIDSCLMIECNDGTLVYTGQIFPSCRTCYGYGEPHFVAFDNHVYGRNYNFYGVGTYAMTQYGRSTSPPFGVTSTFQKCAGEFSCIKSASYREPGLVIELEVPVITNSCYSTNPNCKVKVTVNNVVQTIKKTVEKRSTDEGKVYYIFDDSHGIPTPTSSNVNCINIVGSTGISVSLCSVANDYALLYVWLLPVPSLMNHVYGLCGRYTGTTLNYWMERSGLLITGNSDPAMKTFADTWSVYNEADNSTKTVVGKRSISENKCTNALVKLKIEIECREITAEACESIPAWECSAFTEACVFDLCQFSNHTSYAQGYAEHMLIHIQLANSNDTCYSS